MSEGGGVVFIGLITPGNVAKWVAQNVLADGGAAGTGNVSAVPTPVTGHIATWASPTTIQDGGPVPTGNVTSVPTPVAGHLAVWATPTSIQDGGVPATGNVVVVPSVSIGHLAVWAGPNSIQDGGVPATGNVTSVPTPTAGHAAVWASATSIQDGGVPLPTGAQAANIVLAGPPTGVPALPTFRALTAADLPAIFNAFAMALGQTITPATVAGIKGTVVGDDAAAGSVGEFLSVTTSIAAAVPMSDGLINDIAALVLTPGDWDVWGNIGYVTGGGVVATLLLGWLNTVSLGQPTYPNGGAACSDNGLSPTGTLMTVGMRRYNVTVNTTIFLSSFTSFTVGSLKAYGFIGARRVR